MGIAFDVRPSDAPEREQGPAEEVALENARRKRDATPTAAGELVIACDTVVDVDGELLGKPRDAAQAFAYAGRLAGRAHRVVSGLVVGAAEGVERTAVTFRPADAARLAWYVATGEWRGRAGGYAIQGAGAALVARIDGDYSNVVGLPLGLLLDLRPDLLPVDSTGR